ncbi:hypothetical protein MK139_17245 [bacterium]|nr:hypothetical protein [Gemmatimonadota bacterium]MCH2666072.1 hypothetical protein [bacterium]HCK10120.1 hypothetical protein [Candidatus Latescibacterota bacterium]
MLLFVTLLGGMAGYLVVRLLDGASRGRKMRDIQSTFDFRVDPPIVDRADPPRTGSGHSVI